MAANSQVAMLAHPIILLSREIQNQVRIKTYRVCDFTGRPIPAAQRWAFGFSTNLTSTNLESKRYVYPVCPTAGGHPSSLIQISKFK